MSAKKLTITDTTGAIKGSFNIRYEKMDRDDPPAVEHRVGNVVVKNRSIHDGIVLLEGMTQKVWVDDKGQQYAKEEIKHFYEGNEVTEKGQTKVFEIIGYQPVTSYTDSYVIDKYYEVFPDEDGHKKDFDREIAKRKNLIGMRALWEYLHNNKLVARAEFNVSSSGFLSTDGYIRAISFGNKWTLEIGIFKEEKIFQHLNEGIPEKTTVMEQTLRPNRIKRV